MADFGVGEILRREFSRVGFGWDVKGIVDSTGRVYTLSDDTKLLSKVFELIAYPIIVNAFRPLGVELVPSDRQTVYPDITIVLPEPEPDLAALDLKSTYRKPNGSAGFTLGSYTAYIRPPHTKNIMFPYTQYRQHWVLGFIYTRNPLSSPTVRGIDNLVSIQPVITDIEIIIQEKWRIASDRPGSGNTTNIGSVTNIEQLRAGAGPFTRFGELGERVFLDYWQNYAPRPPRAYSNLSEYIAWRRNNPRADLPLPQP